MTAKPPKPAHADGATSVAPSAGWPSGGCAPLGTPCRSSAAARRRRTALKLRVTPSERARILARVPVGREFSEWARCVLGSGSGEDKSAVTRALIQQIAAVGNNVNQIARALNKCALSGNAVSTLAVAAELRRVRESLEELVK